MKQYGMAMRGHSAHGKRAAPKMNPKVLETWINETLEDDYVHRVEPSAEGGRKMAALIARRLMDALPDSTQ